MHRFTPFLLLSADANPPFPSQLAVQRSLMHSILIDMHTGLPAYASSNLIRSDSDPDDECGWRCVDCSDGIVHTFLFERVLRSQTGEDVSLQLNRMPPSVHYLHVKDAYIGHVSWRTRMLPRELRYLYLCNVSNTQGTENPRDLDLRELPMHMEEFLITYARWTGPLYLTNLPQNLRLLQLQDVLHSFTFVDNRALPTSLEQASVSYMLGSTNRKIRSIDGSKVDKRVKKDRTLRAYSRHYLKFYRRVSNVLFDDNVY